MFLFLFLLVTAVPPAGPAFAHAGREFAIAYAEGDAAARTLAHVLGMIALDRLGFDVRILSLPAGELEAKVLMGGASLAVLPAVAPVGGGSGWRPADDAPPSDTLLWGRYLLAPGELRLLVPVSEREDLRFAAVGAVLGGALARIDLAFFTLLGTIPHAEGKFSGPLRQALKERGIL